MPTCSLFFLPLFPLLLAPLASCSNPFTPRDSDYGSRVPVERLREIDPAHLDRYAAPPASATEPPKPDDIRQRFAGLAEVTLALEDSRAAALQDNLDLQVSLVNPAIAQTAVSEEEARFESVFTTRALWQETDSPTASTLSSAQAAFGSVEPGVTIPLRTGGSASVALPVSRQSTNNPFTFLNPAYNADLVFSISHPLLRNAGRRVATTAIQIAGYNRQVSEAQTKLAIINVLAGTDRAYWQLYGVRRALGVTQQQYELAQAQLDRAGRQVRAGRAAEIEVVRAQAGLAARLEAILVAQNDVLTRQRELKRILNMPGLPVNSPQMVLPGTEPDPVRYSFNRDELIEAAVLSRMEMLELELRLLADAANIHFRKNQTLPELGLDASYRINGLDRSPRGAFESLADNRFEDWSIGASLSVPLGNEAARARLRAALLTRLQRLSSREARRLSIQQEVLDAIDRLEAGWQRILAARQSTILNTRAVQAEQRQFDVGLSTSTQVLDAATRLAESQLAEIRAVVDYQLAQIDLATATGTLLGASKVRWEPAGEHAAQNLEAPAPPVASPPAP